MSKPVKILHNGGLMTTMDIGRERQFMLMQGGFEEVQDFIHHFERFWKCKLGKLQVSLHHKSKHSSNGQSKFFNHDHRKPVTGGSL